ncbi:restriction endonuclease subunit S [Psychrobacter sanguinis]|uniref:restriction endonuclease subunit S n=1 Tax=Psychrobacter sanguinis TaxID=861445 RepID=UPI0028A1DC2E|nr:restriction endonuclease subunit S [Psychrobacter sanguinis]
MVPSGWNRVRPSEVISIFNGFAFKSSDAKDTGTKWLKIANVGIGQIKWDTQSFLPEIYADEYSNFLLKEGDIVVALTRPTLGDKLKVARITTDEDISLLNQRVGRIDCNNKCDSNFIFQVLQSRVLAHRINIGLLGTDPPNLSKKVFDDFYILLPPLPEQQKIAKILTTWDKAINTTERLIENSKQQKKALMQQLLTGQKRLLDHSGQRFSGDWDKKKLRQITTRIQRKSDGNDHPILTISSLSGFMTQKERYSRFMAGESLKKYILLKNGEFAYNKGNSKTYQFGCIFKLEEFETGLVPNIYVCFKINDDLCKDYYKFLFEADYLKPQLGRLVNTGVRNDGLLNIRPDEFLNTKVPVPPLDEQEKIAKVLRSSTRKIELLEQQLADLQQEKKALMQQLLTGKKRVLVD